MTLPANTPQAVCSEPSPDLCSAGFLPGRAHFREPASGAGWELLRGQQFAPGASPVPQPRGRQGHCPCLHSTVRVRLPTSARCPQVLRTSPTETKCERPNTDQSPHQLSRYSLGKCKRLPHCRPPELPPPKSDPTFYALRVPGGGGRRRQTPRVQAWGGPHHPWQQGACFA